MTNPKRVLVTGANGAIARALIPFLAYRDMSVIAASRTAVDLLIQSDQAVSVRQMPDLENQEADFRPLFRDCDVIVHLAGLAHGSLDDKRHNIINNEGTRRLVDAAVEAKIGCFIYISSIAAQVGVSSSDEQTEDNIPCPESAYGRSKLDAELYIRNCGLPHIIFRPVVVQGIDSRGSIHLLTRLAALPLPLPFGGLTAKRSTLSIDNFCSAVAFVIENTACVSGVFVLANAMTDSVRDIFAKERRRAGRPAMMFRIPAWVFKLLLGMAGRARLWSQIGEPLIVNPSRLMSMGWVPVF